MTCDGLPRDDTVRQRVLRAAAHEFARKSYRAVTIEDIAAAGRGLGQGHHLCALRFQGRGGECRHRRSQPPRAHRRQAIR